MNGTGFCCLWISIEASAEDFPSLWAIVVAGSCAVIDPELEINFGGVVGGLDIAGEALLAGVCGVLKGLL